MATLGTQYIQIVPSTKGIGSSISQSLEGPSLEGGKKAGSSIAAGIKGAIGVAAIGTALKAAITEGAALEQSVGGIETLFKESSDKVIANANEAYRTAGLSANEYMEQVTSFSASLLQSLDGDTAKAGTAADQAITDMSDNANKMGTSMEMIQNAYQGFAKQNYTMLDNLKLGYGGTKSEMERLLADAEKLTGKEYDLNNLADVYEAIHVMQTELDITGTTSKEAASTISGSFASMKSAATNVMGALVTGDNLSGAFSGLITSANTFFFDNLIPAIQRLVEQLPQLIGQFVTSGVPVLAKNILGLIPKLLSTVSKVITSLADNINKAVNNFAKGGKMSKGAKEAIKDFASGIIKAIPQVVVAVGKLIVAIIGSFAKLPSKLWAFGKSVIKSFAEGLRSFKLKLPHIKFNDYGKIPWGIGGKGKAPDIGIEWYAKGGIFNSPSVIGVGEAGSEAVVPLDKLWSALESNNSSSSGRLNVVINLDGQTIGQSAVSYINGQTLAFGTSLI